MYYSKYLYELVAGKLKTVTSLEFDGTNSNFFHFVQKVHVVIVELLNMAITTKDRESSTYIQTKKTDTYKTFVRSLGKVKLLFLIVNLLN